MSRSASHLVSAPVPVVVPARLPLRAAIGSRVLCHDVAAVTQLEVAREDGRPRSVVTFAFPARITVASRRVAQSVTRTMCGLPKDTEVNCPEDLESATGCTSLPPASTGIRSWPAPRAARRSWGSAGQCGMRPRGSGNYSAWP